MKPTNKTRHALVLALFLSSLSLFGLGMPDLPLREGGEGDLGPLEGLSGVYTPFADFADRPYRPDLAGQSALDRSRGLEAFAVLPAEEAARMRQITFAGIRERALFLGKGLDFGASAALDEGLFLFFKMDAVAEYSRGKGSKGLQAAGSGALGITGLAPLPWALSFRMTARKGGYVLGGSHLESTQTLALPAWLGRVRVFEGLGFTASYCHPDDEGEGSEAALYARARLEAGRREWRGAFDQGWSFWLEGIESYATEDSHAGFFAGELFAGADGALRIRDFAGLRAKADLRLSNEVRDDWANSIRGVSDYGATYEGNWGITTSLEVPLLFARGYLFRDAAQAVEFTLSPFVDLALVRQPGRALSDNGSLRGGTGAELAMCLDGQSRSSLRFYGGYDLSANLGRIVDPIDSGSGMEVGASLYLDLP